MTGLPCARLRPAILAVALFFVFLFVVLPLAAAVVVPFFAPWEVGVPVALGAVAFAALAGYVMSSSPHWVELDGDIIRGRRLLTRKIVEYRVGDLVDAKPIHTDYLGPLQNSILDALLDTSNRGYQLFFRDGGRIPLIRADMSGLDSFLAALGEQIKLMRQDRPGD